MSIAAFLRDHRDQILADWKLDAQRMAIAAGRMEPALANSLPRLVEEFACMVAGEQARADSLANDCAAAFLESSAPLADLVRELALFRRCVLRSWRERNPAGLHDEAARAAAEIDAVAERTVERYLDLRTNLLDAYERIALSAMATATLDGFFHELLAILASLPISPDALAIFVRDGERLELRATRGRLPAAVPTAIPNADAFEALPGWYSVPLLDGQEIVGLALAASITRREFSGTEKHVFALVARRAAPTISQHRQRAKANKQAAEMDAFIAAIESPVYFGTAGRFSNANDAGLELLGVASTDELQRLSVMDLVERLQLRDPTSADLPSYEHSVFSRALAGEHLTLDCSALHRETGSRCYYRCIAGPVISDGRLEGTVLVLSDITAIKRAEDRFRTMFERIPMAIAQSDPASGTVVRANAKMCELTGYPLEELVGRSFAEWTHPDDRAENMEQYQRMVRGEIDVYTTEKRYIRKNGEARWVRVTAGLLPSPGEAPRTLATIEDVTERRAAELEREQLLAREHAAREAAERARTELDRAAEFRERFLAIVSHDLRNPLNAILLTTQRLSSTRDLPASFASRLGRIRTSANRMVQMVAELLDLTRGRLGGGIPIELTKGDLLAIVRATIDELELAYPSRHIVLRASGVFEGSYDQERLAQVTSNLIGNALQHGPEDGLVEVSLVDRGDAGVVLQVKNGGTPIPSELLPHLFEPFRRGSGSTNGLGLGLFIASEVVRAHRGTIEATSTDAAGTTFTVSLPRVRGDQPTSISVDAVSYAEPTEMRGYVSSRR